jgi:putative membrane protein
MKNYKSALLQAIVFITVIIGASSYMDSKSEDSQEVAHTINDEGFDKRRSEEAADFLLNVAEINSDEIILGKLAQQKGTEKQVKELGKMMEEEHTNSANSLNALLKTKNISLPAFQSEAGQDAYKKLKHKSGNDFDKEYADMMVSEHKDAILLFETASLLCIDPEIKAWATESLPRLRTNLENSIMCQEECNKI